MDNIYAELLNIKNKYGELTAKNVLKEASKKRNPLHAYFDWDDGEAAFKWRLHQANMIIVRAKVTIEHHEEKHINAFVSVKSDEEQPPRFVHVADAISDSVLASQLFEQLHSKIERLEDQLLAMKQYFGASKKTLQTAKKQIAKQAKALKKSA